MLPRARRRRDGAGARARRPDSPRGDRGRARRTCAAATARRHDRPPRWGAPRGIFHGDPSSPRRLTAQMCGIIGVTGIPDAARLAYLGLYSLQHRGQESAGIVAVDGAGVRSEEHTSELQSLAYLVCRLLLEKKKNMKLRS